MELAPDGEARFYRPDGRPLPETPELSAPAREPVTALVARLASHGVAVDGGATLPDWWGGSVDYGWEIDWLRWRDHPDPTSAAG
jgi:glucose/arabinose dehydrogenase